LAEEFDMTRQAVSKHIKILNECEPLEQQKAGREIYYQLKVDKMKEIDTWSEQFRAVWETRFNQLDMYLSLFNAGKQKSNTSIKIHQRQMGRL